MAHHTLRNHIKLSRLCRLIGCGKAEAYGLVALLWDSAYQDRSIGSDGTLSGCDKLDIAVMCERPGDGVELVRSLVEAGFLDETDDGYRIHNYGRWAPEYVLRRWKRASVRTCPTTDRRMSATDRTCPSVPNPTKPNQTKPREQKQQARTGSAKPVQADGVWGKSTIKLDTNTWKFVGITDADRAQWAEAYPAVDVPAELARAAAWCKTNPDKGRKSNYGSFLTRWFTKAQDQGGGRVSAPPTHNRPKSEPGKYAGM